ncbi:Toll-like receptor 7 [Gryllus bimaculatus]|nr:Toll-like receptor 7 [Gryllus bimaculatus]
MGCVNTRPTCGRARGWRLGSRRSRPGPVAAPGPAAPTAAAGWLLPVAGWRARCQRRRTTAGGEGGRGPRPGLGAALPSSDLGRTSRQLGQWKRNDTADGGGGRSGPATGAVWDDVPRCARSRAGDGAGLSAVLARERPCRPAVRSAQPAFEEPREDWQCCCTCRRDQVLRRAAGRLRERASRLNTRNAEWGSGKALELAPGTFRGCGADRRSTSPTTTCARCPTPPPFCRWPTCSARSTPAATACGARALGVSLPRAAGRARRPPPGPPSGRTEDAPGGGDMRSLDLSHNQLQALPSESSISRLRRLQALHLQHNEMTDIGGEAFAGLASLRTLNMSHNRLDVLPEGLFASCRELREIDLHNNSLYELGRGLFHRLEQLLVLDLSYNQLSSGQIDDGTFVGLIRLIVLNLAHNSLTRVDARTFKDLFFLQILDLRQNSIGYIEDNAFHPLYNLHTLHLSENRLHEIGPLMFNGLFVLNKLTISNNLLISIDGRAFRNCSDLKELDLSSNSLQDVPDALHELTFLKTLDLGENNISTVRNGSFRNLQQLNGLRLIGNNIGNLTSDMFWDLTSLQVLNLAKNKIQQIERGTFEHNERIEAIRLDGNFLTDIDGVFSKISSLLWLNLSNNHLVWFDYAFVPVNLQWLDIHDNFIELLGNYYNRQDSLHIKTLDASHNRITELNAMSIPNSVELLFINNNFITSVAAGTFIEKTDLVRVDMYANSLVSLDLNALRLTDVPPQKPLPEFYIGGNPFHCDCGMEWLQMINNRTQLRIHPRIMDLANIMCAMTYSRGLTTMPAIDAKPSNFLCTYETHCFALCHCCDFDACDCEMTCPNNCSCYHDQTWTTNVVDCSGLATSQIPRRIPMDATELYLDGNDFGELQNHVFIGRKNLRILFVNASRIETIQNRTFNGLNALQILHLEDNRIRELKGFEFDHLSHLRELYLQNNLISFIGNVTLLPLHSLEILRLDGNRLVTFPVWQLTLNQALEEISLGNNLWSCRCKFLQELQMWVADNARKVIDSEDIYCYNNETKPAQRREVDLNNTACSDYYSGGSVIQSIIVSDYLPMVVITLSAIVLVLILTVLLFVFREPMRVWVYSRYGIRLFEFKGGASKHLAEDREKLYDGYVCYSPKDEEFVLQSIVAELEHGNPSFQLCLHYRDLPHHAFLQHSSSPVVVEAADASRRVILVLSRNFLQTEWSRFEFRSALHEALKGRVFKLVLVEDGGSLPEAELDPDLRPYLKTGARVRWGEKRFWERLRYAMPSRGRDHKMYRRNINNYTLDSGKCRNGSHHHRTWRRTSSRTRRPQFAHAHQQPPAVPGRPATTNDACPTTWRRPLRTPATHAAPHAGQAEQPPRANHHHHHHHHPDAATAAAAAPARAHDTKPTTPPPPPPPRRRARTTGTTTTTARPVDGPGGGGVDHNALWSTRRQWRGAAASGAAGAGARPGFEARLRAHLLLHRLGLLHAGAGGLLRDAQRAATAPRAGPGAAAAPPRAADAAAAATSAGVALGGVHGPRRRAGLPRGCVADRVESSGLIQYSERCSRERMKESKRLLLRSHLRSIF